MINPYFTSHYPGYESEKNLVEGMIIESIQISGIEVSYIPRTLSSSLDHVFGEDVLSSFDSHANIEVFIQDFAGPGGASEMLQRFGMEIRDTASFTISRKRYKETVSPIVPASRDASLVWRPCEGDLIYVPFSKSLYEIMFVEDESEGYYQLNRKYVWSLRCELVRLNNEKIATGNQEIDEYFGPNLNRLNMSILSESGDHILSESGGYILSEDYEVSKQYDDHRGFGDNDLIKKEFLSIMDFDDSNPFIN